jgi:hypothetical protein
MAQLSWSKTLTQARPGDPGGPAARSSLTSGDSGQGLVTRPRACQWRPLSVLVRKLITDPAGSAAHIWPAEIRPAATAVANTGPEAASRPHAAIASAGMCRERRSMACRRRPAR